MGDHTFSRTAYKSAVKQNTTAGKSATARGEEVVRNTGKLDPFVDPAEFGVIRESRIRLEQRPDGLWVVLVGAPFPIEYRLDTTGSMGDNVERALRVLPLICELVGAVLPGRDPHYCASIFADVMDRFALCRGQFEMLADRMVNQLTLMHPEGGGYGNGGENPEYGLFGATYLTKAYLQRIGLKSYDFTITDEPGRDRFSLDQLKRVFGPQVMEKVKENGYEMSARNLPSARDAVNDLFRRAHVFCLLIGDRDDARDYWPDLYGKERVVFMPVIEHLPHVMAVIVGLTEGTLDLRSGLDFLESHEINKTAAGSIIEAVSGIPLGAQRALPNYGKIPVKGDLFAAKTDLWPINPDEVPAVEPEKSGKKPGKGGDPASDGGWL
jgi:hypothetical protein